MKKHLIFFTLLAAASPAMAQPVDIVGGADATTQLITHCGFLPVLDTNYASSPLTIGIIQRKLHQLGYYHGPQNGIYGKDTTRAMQSFQSDYGLAENGRAGPATVQQLAYASHPSGHVRHCNRMAPPIG